MHSQNRGAGWGPGNPRGPAILVLALMSLFVSRLSPQTIPAPAQPVRDVVCYVVVEESQSSEGDELFLRKMGVDPEAVKTFAPVSFSRRGGKFEAVVRGAFGYQARNPRRLASSGKLALYEVPLKIKSDPPPRPWKTARVSIDIAELSPSGGIVQPSVAAMDKAAAALKVTSGMAWIIEMRYSGKGRLNALVGLAR